MHRGGQERAAGLPHLTCRANATSLPSPFGCATLTKLPCTAADSDRALAGVRSEVKVTEPVLASQVLLGGEKAFTYDYVFGPDTGQVHASESSSSRLKLARLRFARFPLFRFASFFPPCS